MFLGSVFSVPVAAATGNIYSWTGKVQLSANRTYCINDKVTVDGSFSLPQDSTLNIQSGGSLTIPSGSSLTIDGSVVIENGASLVLGGTLEIAENGSLSVDGIFSAMSGSAVTLNGSMLCSQTGSAYLAAGIADGADSQLYSYGNITFAGGFSGAGDHYFYGGSARFSSSTVFGGGSTAVFDNRFKIFSGAAVKNYGKITLDENCEYTMSGKYQNYESGTVIDNRRKYSDSAMSISEISLNTCEPFTMIDVAYVQGEIDWKKVKAAGIDHAMIRCGRGRLSDDYPIKNDTYFHGNILGAMQNDIEVGVYFYSYAETAEEARDEARFVLSLIQDYDITFPVAFDIEDPWYTNNNYTKEQLTDITQAFCSEIKKAGYLPIIYTYASFFYYNLDMEALGEYPVWVAHYGVDEPDYDGTYFMWQYTYQGKIDGIDGDVDMDKCYVDFPSYIRKNNLNQLG